MDEAKKARQYFSVDLEKFKVNFEAFPIFITIVISIPGKRFINASRILCKIVQEFLHWKNVFNLLHYPNQTSLRRLQENGKYSFSIVGPMMLLI